MLTFRLSTENVMNLLRFPCAFPSTFLLIIFFSPFRLILPLRPTQTIPFPFFQDYLKSKTGARSVPRVFIGGKCLGGGDETAKAAADGSLKTMLKEVGAL